MKKYFNIKFEKVYSEDGRSSIFRPNNKER